MKFILFAFILSLTNIASAGQKTKETTLANQEDFIVISDIKSSEASIFLSYAGKKMNHCGIVLQTHSFGADVEEIQKVLIIQSRQQLGGNIAEVINGQLGAKVKDPDALSYGEFFTIKTKSDMPLNKVIQNLGAIHKTDLIVKILACD